MFLGWIVLVLAHLRWVVFMLTQLVFCVGNADPGHQNSRRQKSRD
jgi:hypothetical protein